MQIIKFSFCIHFLSSLLTPPTRYTKRNAFSGLNKGIHTVIIAMTSCNDVIAIFLFYVMCGVLFSTGNLTHQLLQGPVGIVLGCVFGALSGLLVLRLPSDKAVTRTTISPFPSVSLRISIRKKSLERVGEMFCAYQITFSGFASNSMPLPIDGGVDE
jgi:hypothetical protein